jgi:hypothetical protein
VRTEGIGGWISSIVQCCIEPFSLRPVNTIWPSISMPHTLGVALSAG